MTNFYFSSCKKRGYSSWGVRLHHGAPPAYVTNVHTKSTHKIGTCVPHDRNNCFANIQLKKS